MDRLNSVDKSLILLALKAKFRGLKPSISDYHRDLKKIFNCSLCYSAVRNRLRRLEQLGLLRSELVKGLARNDLVDSKGEIKLKRHTREWKRIYCPNDCREEVKRFLRSLMSLAGDLLGKLSQVLCDDELLKSLA